MYSEKKKAIFLDRDGVLIQERGDYTWLLEDLKINQGVPEALQNFSKEGYLLIVISNQGGIGRDLYTKQEADYLHLHISRSLGMSGIKIDEYYYCPHHPTTSNCICRKPDSQLLEKAIARFNIDPEKSFFIGDTERDILAGRKAGVNTILIEPNSDLRLITLSDF
jgi:D-glycero-D-manno-heptose 1,7-bisphosphate phosphatase